MFVSQIWHLNIQLNHIVDWLDFENAYLLLNIGADTAANGPNLPNFRHTIWPFCAKKHEKKAKTKLGPLRMQNFPIALLEVTWRTRRSGRSSTGWCGRRTSGGWTRTTTQASTTWTPRTSVLSAAMALILRMEISTQNDGLNSNWIDEIFDCNSSMNFAAHFQIRSSDSCKNICRWFGKCQQIRWISVIYRFLWIPGTFDISTLAEFRRNLEQSYVANSLDSFQNLNIGTEFEN